MVTTRISKEEGVTTNTSIVGENDSETIEPMDVSQLLRSLATVAKAVQDVPYMEDLAVQAALPSIRTALSSAQESLIELLQSMLPELASGMDLNDVESIDDRDVWELCAEVFESLLEQLDDKELATVSSSTGVIKALLPEAQDIPKPQDTLDFIVQNSRTEPFVPPLRSKPHSQEPLDLSLRQGHGLETARRRTGKEARSILSSQPLIAPSRHVPHPYRTELETLHFMDSQMDVLKGLTSHIQAKDKLDATWIDTEARLRELAGRLASCSEIAVDLEAHSYRTFSGFVCLMQISIRQKGNFAEMDNYLIDALSLRSHLNEYLGPIFAHPDIVKVMHGANHDVLWLQRDFGIYIINLFDTGQASRVLMYPSRSYGYLLQRFCGIVADKSHQLSDWRLRPLPPDMQEYAIQDTYYLLDMYECLKWELAHVDSDGDGRSLILQVLNASRDICLFRYAVEPFKPLGYRKLVAFRGNGGLEIKSSVTFDAQEKVLASLWDWRDATARARDESVAYVCPNAVLIRLAQTCPSTLAQLLSCSRPLPPLLEELSQEVLDRMMTSKCQDVDVALSNNNELLPSFVDGGKSLLSSIPTSSHSAFFNASDRQIRRTMMSPILGTEALYKQAGWLTPRTFRSTSDDSGEDGRLIDVNSTSSNEDADGGTDEEDADVRRTKSGLADKRATTSSTTGRSDLGFVYDNTEDSGSDKVGPAKSTDGLATLRAAGASIKTVAEDVSDAKNVSTRIQSQMLKTQHFSKVIGFLTSKDTDEDDDDAIDTELVAQSSVQDSLTPVEGEELPVPRSMREIYRISNRNRRYKKAGSPIFEREASTNEKEKEELLKSEAILKEQGFWGKDYLEEFANPSAAVAPHSTSPIKRPRTKSRTGRESEESVPQDSSSVASKEDDLAFMKEIGWIQDSDDVNSVLSRKVAAPCAIEDHRGIAAEKQDNPPLGSAPLSSLVHANPFFKASGDEMRTPASVRPATGNRTPTSKKDGKGTGSIKSKRQVERTERKEGRMHVYRKR